MKITETDVLVVGAGPAGLTASALLARSGVASINVSKYGATADSPRAHITNQRAMEIFRDLGIEERVAGRALPQHLMGKQVFATSFAGREFARMMTWGTGDDRLGDYQAASPTQMCNAPQHILEPMLLDAARGFGADIRFNTELTAIEQGADFATATLKDRSNDGETHQIRARYILGCDGARSVVGEQGEFRFEGSAGFVDCITVWIEADLTRYAKHRSGALFFVLPPGAEDLLSIWSCVEPWTEWSTIFTRHGGATGDSSERAVLERVRTAIGDPTVDVKIKKISEWQFNHVFASNYRDGRLFLAGDAAHRHPPANGLGSNTSVQDAYNIAWKLALVLRGHAGDALLDTYESERQPVGRKVVERASQSVDEVVPLLVALGVNPEETPEEGRARIDGLLGPSGESSRAELAAALELMNGQFNAHGVELGQRYQSSAVVPAGQEPPAYERDSDLYYHPTSYPGASLPHAWLERDGSEISTLDLCGYEQFTLLVGVGGQAWHDAADEVRRRLNVTVKAVTIGLGQTNNDVLGTWTRLRETSDRGCVLVRPDRHIAWRTDDLPDNPVALLQGALTTILSRQPERS